MSFFDNKSIGIDIADHRILVAKLVKQGGVFAGDTFVGAELESGIIVDGRIKNKEALTKVFKELLQKIKIESSGEKNIVFGLPKNQAYVHVFSDSSGNNNDDYINQIIKKDTEESIPLEVDDIYYTSKILNKTPDKNTFLVIAVSKEMIREWQDFFKNIGLSIQVYDLQSLATLRNLFTKLPANPFCVIDIGSDFTSITIFNNKGLRYSHTIKVAGINFSIQIAKELNISFEEAEKFKIKNGMPKTGKIFPVMKNNLEPIVKTTKEIFAYIKNMSAEEIEKIILIGGSALMKGLPEYLQEVIGVPVELGKPIITKGKTDFEFLNSIGLAMRGFEKRSNQKDPGLSPLKLEEKIILKKSKIIENKLEYKEVDFRKIEEVKKIKKEKIILLIILIFGLILIGLAFWYRNNQTQKKQLNNFATLNLYNNLEKINLEIPVAVSQNEYTIDRIKGRIVESVDANLQTGERVWHEPIAQNPNLWLVYSETDAKTILLAKIKNDITANFSFDSINYIGVIKTDNPNIFTLKTEISFYTAEPIKK